MGFPDFPVPESDKSYLPAKDMLAFLKLYADKHGVTEKIKVSHSVYNILKRLLKFSSIYLQNLPITSSFNLNLSVDKKPASSYRLPNKISLQNFATNLRYSL